MEFTDVLYRPPFYFSNFQEDILQNKKSARFAGTFSSRAARFARKFERT